MFNLVNISTSPGLSADPVLELSGISADVQLRAAEEAFQQKNEGSFTPMSELLVVFIR